MSRVTHVLREMLRNLHRNWGIALGSLLSLTLIFLLFDLFWIAVGTSDRFYDQLLSELELEVFVSDQLPEVELGALRARITEVPGIRYATYVSKETARDELRRLVGSDLLVGYDSANPLPRSFVIAFETEYLTSSEVSNIDSRIAAMTGVTKTYYARGWLEKAESTKGILLDIGMVLGGLILLTALIGTANNIRLMTQARAIGIQQMLLLGAGRLFLALPFLIEGFLVAGFSAAVGWLVVWYFKERVRFTAFEIVYPLPDYVAAYCLAAAVLGAVSGYFGIRKLFEEA